MKIIDEAYRMTNFRGLADADPFIRMMEGCRMLNPAVWTPMKHVLDLKGWLRPFTICMQKGFCLYMNVLLTFASCTFHLHPRFYLLLISLKGDFTALVLSRQTYSLHSIYLSYLSTDYEVLPHRHHRLCWPLSRMDALMG